MSEINKFWKWFSANGDKIKAATDPIPKEILDGILENLHKVDEGLYFDIGHDPMSTEVEFVVTPRGDISKCDIIKELISNAPKLTDWIFIAFRPAMGFDYKTEHEGIEIDPKKLWFLPLSSVEDPKSIGINIGVKGFKEELKDNYLDACYIALDTCIGEEKSMNDVQFVDVCALPADPESEGFIEFVEIGEYIDWKKEQ